MSSLFNYKGNLTDLQMTHIFPCSSPQNLVCSHLSSYTVERHHTKWLNKNPLVHSPWQPDSVLQYFHHELDTNLENKLLINVLKKHLADANLDKYYRLFYMSKTQTQIAKKCLILIYTQILILYLKC